MVLSSHISLEGSEEAVVQSCLLTSRCSLACNSKAPVLLSFFLGTLLSEGIDHFAIELTLIAVYSSVVEQ